MSELDNKGRKIIREDTKHLEIMIEDLLRKPYWIIDVLPEQVPADAAGQYFAVERYFLQPERIQNLRRRYAEILLKLNCYYDMWISFDFTDDWEKNPDPEIFAGRVENMPGNGYLRAIFPEQQVMIDQDGCETSMTVYDPENILYKKLKRFAEAAGLFIWRVPGLWIEK